jgi:hypothetical protein
MQSAAISKLNMLKDVIDMLNEAATVLEDRPREFSVDKKHY